MRPWSVPALPIERSPSACLSPSDPPKATSSELETSWVSIHEPRSPHGLSNTDFFRVPISETRKSTDFHSASTIDTKLQPSADDRAWNSEPGASWSWPVRPWSGSVLRTTRHPVDSPVLSLGSIRLRRMPTQRRASVFRVESLLSPFVTVRPQLWNQRATTHHCGVRARITRKGQITIPKQIRDRLGLQPGDDLDFVTEGGAIAIRKAGRQQAVRTFPGLPTWACGQGSRPARRGAPRGLSEVTLRLATGGVRLV